MLGVARSRRLADMHLMIPNLTYEDRRRSLGRLALWWVETFRLIGRGGATGKPVTHSPEYIQFYLNAGWSAQVQSCELVASEGLQQEWFGQ